MLGLPDGITACLFDLDGVLTKTATVHARAWKQMFDAYLREHGDERPFDEHDDYDTYVDGKPRDAGVRDFLASRGLHPAEDEIARLGNIKNALVLELIRTDGVEAYPGSVRYLEAARDAGLRRAVVSSSHNCEDVLKAAGIDHLLEVRVDGLVADAQHLAGKPHPDTFLEGARRLGVPRAQAAVFEDALAGVEAGRAGDFGQVVGVDRVGQRDKLRDHGADVVVEDLEELL
ncbi:beta-phosphoglucomutase family hydrolase [Candidatus Solirubrobacter pratensis]|uniref:beta-phosphoglucomutase family hydrolase n=1 Tax=Candidatus Solirubrobacter pratensis TaxID=1298857 RepID=UPI000417C6EE|nr:beta-phosphoglucomutase family hydrolase [Candidatus Solirubrobacter pratensis]